MAGPGRIKLLNPVILAGFSFLIFAPIELIAGFTLHNPTISANASHDAFDGLFFLIGGSIDVLLARSTRHALYCWSRKGLSIAIGLLASVFVGIGILLAQTPEAGASQLVAALILGPASIALNWWWHKRLEVHGDEHHHGYNVHLLVDAGSGLIVIGAAILTTALDDATINLWGAYSILSLAFFLGVRALWRDFPTLIHRPSNHPLTTGSHGQTH